MDGLKYFISYSRDNTKKILKIVTLLKKESIKINIDTNDILPTEHWRKRIDELIFMSDVFIYMISSSSLSSSECSNELERAIKYKKRIIPVIVTQDFEQSEIPISITSINYLFCLDDDVSHIHKEINSAIYLDIQKIRDNTRILTSARYWEISGKDSSNLLRGGNLKNAKKQKDKSIENEELTPLVINYIYESEVNENKEIQLRKDIELRRKITQSKQLANSIKTFIEDNADMMLGYAIFELLDGRESRNSQINTPHDKEGSFILANAVLTLRLSKSIDSENVQRIIISNDGDKIICTTKDNYVFLYDITKHIQISSFDLGGTYNHDISFSYDGNSILTTPHIMDLKYRNASVAIWNSSTGKVISKFDTDWKDDEIFKAELSPDSKYLITISGNGAYDKFGEGDAILWNTESGEIIKFISDGVLGVEFSPDSSFFTTKMLYMDGIKRWSAKTGKEIEMDGYAALTDMVGVKTSGRIIDMNNESAISNLGHGFDSVRISPDSSLIYVRYVNKLDIVNSSDGKIINSFEF